MTHHDKEDWTIPVTDVWDKLREIMQARYEDAFSGNI
jgi:hypothetical protein